MNYWPLLGVAWVVAGFVLRRNPVLVVVGAGLVSGLAAGLSLPRILALLGESFVSNRALLLFVLTLPTIGLLERAGLREHAHAWIAGMRRLTLARLLVSYLGLRQLLSMLGLTHVGGHPQTVRPLLAPMSEAAAEKHLGELQHRQRQRIYALDAATDNVGLFFGEDVFVAIGAVLLIQGFYAEQGIVLEPLHIALWALPTAIAAFVIHGIRIVLFQRNLIRAAQADDSEDEHPVSSFPRAERSETTAKPARRASAQAREKRESSDFEPTKTKSLDSRLRGNDERNPEADRDPD